MSSKFIHVAACVRIAFLSKAHSKYTAHVVYPLFMGTRVIPTCWLWWIMPLPSFNNSQLGGNPISSVTLPLSPFILLPSKSEHGTLQIVFSIWLKITNQGESESGNQHYFIPINLNLFDIKMKCRWGGKVVRNGRWGRRSRSESGGGCLYGHELLLSPPYCHLLPLNLWSPCPRSRKESKAQRPLQPA